MCSKSTYISCGLLLIQILCIYRLWLKFSRNCWSSSSDSFSFTTSTSQTFMSIWQIIIQILHLVIIMGILHFPFWLCFILRQNKTDFFCHVRHNFFESSTNLKFQARIISEQCACKFYPMEVNLGFTDFPFFCHWWENKEKWE